jgi:hypothetical protein
VLSIDHNAPITRPTPRIVFPEKPDFKRLMDPDRTKEVQKPFPRPVRQGLGIGDDFYQLWGERFDARLYVSLEEVQETREFTSEFWFSRRKELEGETNEYDRLRVRALRLLRNAYFGESDESFQDVFDRAMKMLTHHPQNLIPRLRGRNSQALEFSIRGKEREAARHIYPLFLSKMMERAKVRMWCKDGEWVPVIWCPNMTTAMYVHAAFNGVETCLNCEKVFCRDVPRVDGSRSEKYCTIACGQRFRQRMHRRRQKSKGESR